MNTQRSCRLIHYANEKFSLKPRKYEDSQLRGHSKPNGLWFSVEGEYDWKWWCESEDYNLENLIVSYEIILKKDAYILHLKTAGEIREFGKLYHRPTRPWNSENDTYELKWKKVKEKYQGIIIAPYQMDCRLALETSWYYGWDCSSGCIWDLDCIEEFKLRELNLGELNDN